MGLTKQNQGVRKAILFLKPLTGRIHFHALKLSFFFPYIIFIFFPFYYSYVHTRLGSFLPPAPTPSLTTHFAPSLSPPIPSRNYFALISNFVVERE
jgi:hypothetical protein